MKKKKNTKYLDFYNEHIKTGKINNGLCNDLMNREFTTQKSGNDKFLELIKPSYEELEELVNKDMDHVYWGSGKTSNLSEDSNTFTPLRQNIVLLCACLAGEL